jgi:hypothetical protein
MPIHLLTDLNNLKCHIEIIINLDAYHEINNILHYNDFFNLLYQMSMEFKNIIGDTQMYNVSNPDVNGLLKYLRQYTNLNVNSKSKKGA